ncbi:hypothetical protein BASA60_003040 [Batrachochytrium salamandrivorans]|nr:hypothetical protein BASA60_003040 [Batrachochytrium salamandrivorans]
MQIPSQEFPSTFDISDYDCPLAVLPKILHSATLSGNPVSYSSTQAYPRTHSDASIRVGQTSGTTTGMGQAQEYIIVDRDHENLNSFPQSHHTQHSSGGKDVASQTSSTPGSISSA